MSEARPSTAEGWGSWVQWWMGWRQKTLTEKLVVWLAWHLPRSVVSWCVIRVWAHATTGPYSLDEPTGVDVFTALKRWDLSHSSRS